MQNILRAMSKINARKKGNAFELYCIDKLSALFPQAVSSRSESKRMDDAGVDICYTGSFHFQCKAVERLGTYHDILSGMPEDKIRVILHKRNRKGTVAVLSFDDFIEMAKSYNK